MFRLLFVFLIAATSLQAQNKKQAPKSSTVATTPDDSTKAKDAPEIDQPPPREFAVYTKRKKKERTKLCFNLITPDSNTILNHCINDSVCRDPEVYKILWQKTEADSTFALVYVQAFSKPVDKPACDLGKEIKLAFIRWNTATNKATLKQKNIESCMKNITNMTKEPVRDWDGTSPLTINYYRGSGGFQEIRFDPAEFRKGFQGGDE